MSCNMMEGFMTAFILAVALPCAQSEITVRGTAGQNITLDTGVTGLYGDYQILWSRGSEQHVILNFYDRKLDWKEPHERFHLDRTTGSFTIRSLCVSDSGLYQGQIINGNGSMHIFNLTVVEAEPITPTAGSLSSITANPRNHAAAMVSSGISGLICFVLLVCGVTWMRKRGYCQSNSVVV